MTPDEHVQRLAETNPAALEPPTDRQKHAIAFGNKPNYGLSEKELQAVEQMTVVAEKQRLDITLPARTDRRDPRLWNIIPFPPENQPLGKPLFPEQDLMSMAEKALLPDMGIPVEFFRDHDAEFIQGVAGESYVPRGQKGVTRDDIEKCVRSLPRMPCHPPTYGEMPDRGHEIPHGGEFVAWNARHFNYTETLTPLESELCRKYATAHGNDLIGLLDIIAKDAFTRQSANRSRCWRYYVESMFIDNWHLLTVLARLGIYAGVVTRVQTKESDPCPPTTTDPKSPPANPT